MSCNEREQEKQEDTHGDDDDDDGDAIQQGEWESTSVVSWRDGRMRLRQNDKLWNSHFRLSTVLSPFRD